VEELLDSQSTCIDYQKLSDVLSSSKSWDMDLTEIMDAQSLIENYRAG
jgi:hypothetical protein